MPSLTEEPEDKLILLAPDQMVSVREVFGVDTEMMVPRFSTRDPHVPDFDEAYRFDPETTLAICAGLAFDRRVMIQGYHGTGKVIDAHRTGGVAAELADDPGQSGQPCQPHRPGRQGRHRAEGWQTDHRIPRRHAALGAATADRPRLRRIRRRPARRDVRHPARPGVGQQADPPGPEPGHPGQSRISGCSPRQTPSVSATPQASITALSRSIRVRWTAGRWSPR